VQLTTLAGDRQMVSAVTKVKVTIASLAVLGVGRDADAEDNVVRVGSSLNVILTFRA
jgi:hypothetical protein